MHARTHTCLFFKILKYFKLFTNLIFLLGIWFCVCWITWRCIQFPQKLFQDPNWPSVWSLWEGLKHSNSQSPSFPLCPCQWWWITPSFPGTHKSIWPTSMVMPLSFHWIPQAWGCRVPDGGRMLPRHSPKSLVHYSLLYCFLNSLPVYDSDSQGSFWISL